MGASAQLAETVSVRVIRPGSIGGGVGAPLPTRAQLHERPERRLRRVGVDRLQRPELHRRAARIELGAMRGVLDRLDAQRVLARLAVGDVEADALVIGAVLRPPGRSARRPCRAAAPAPRCGWSPDSRRRRAAGSDCCSTPDRATRPTVAMSLASTPAAFSPAITASARRAFSFAASAAVGFSTSIDRLTMATSGLASSLAWPTDGDGRRRRPPRLGALSSAAAATGAKARAAASKAGTAFIGFLPRRTAVGVGLRRGGAARGARRVHFLTKS